jgi:hypothetical protein
VLTLAHHTALVAAVMALGSAALRGASALTPGGLERVLVAVVLGAAAAVAQALVLGLVGLGSSPIALLLAAGATWLAVRATLPTPAIAVLDELSAAARAAPLAAWLCLGAAAAVLLALAVYFLRYPAVGIDGTAHHLPAIVNWIHSGHMGAEVHPNEDFPVGAYPLTHEVLMAWTMGLSRSFVPVALWAPAMLALLATAGWVGLRRLGVAAGVTALAIVAVAVAPPLVGGLNAPKNDLAALAWLAVAAALCVAAVRRPALLAVALLAGGLSIGTKTTSGPLIALMLAVALYLTWRRGDLVAPVPRLLGAAFVAAAGVGGVWYLRNLVVHGSPLWPFIATPWGEDVPRAISRLDPSFVDRPLASLEGRTATYVNGLAGGLILMGTGMLAWLLSRRRAAVVASAATALAFLAWAFAPFTGIADDRYVDLSLFVIRYLMPAITVGAVALALASRAGGARGLIAIALLSAATAWSAFKSLDLGYPLVPSIAVTGAALAAGAAVGFVARRLGAPGPGALRILGGATAAVAAVALAAAAPGYVERHARTNATFAEPVITWFAAQKDFRDGDELISLSPQAIGPLAGDRLQHDVELIPGRTSCAKVLALARSGYVVVRDLPQLTRRYLTPYRAGECLAGEPTIFDGADFRVYRLSAEPQSARARPSR